MNTIDPLGDEVAQAYVMTTPDQRKAVAESYDSKGNLHETYAELLQINPNGLLVASLLEVCHPAICDGEKPKANNYGVLLKMALKPVDK